MASTTASPKTCPNCNHLNSEHDAHCSWCGAGLDQASSEVYVKYEWPFGLGGIRYSRTGWWLTMLPVIALQVFVICFVVLLEGPICVLVIPFLMIGLWILLWSVGRQGAQLEKRP